MNVALLRLLAVIFSTLYLITGSASRPEVINIGAILALKSTIGKVAEVAMNAAIDDINSNPAILHGTKLNMSMMDSNYNGFLGIVEALQLLEKDTVAIIGPQSSVTAHVIGHMANVLQVPLLSFSSTDPTLSPIQFPFFLRTSQNDEFQMSAIADIVEHYGWRDVIAVYSDDDHGRNGIAVLGDKLNAKQCRISFKAVLSPKEPTRDEITGLLVQVALMESRIIVMHLPDTWGLKVFSVAQYLGMVTTGYVFIVTNWLSTLLETSSPLPQDAIDSIQGVLTLRMYTPDTDAKSKFISRWSGLTKGKNVQDPAGINAYAFYAYDTVWILAHAIDSFLNQGGNISFSDLSSLQNLQHGNLHLDALSVFDEGHMFLQNILQVNMNGLTGQVKFTSQRDLINPAYDIINVIGNGYRRIGYWSNHSHLTTSPPETLWGKPPNISSSNQRLYSVIWPGQSTDRPRGWVFPNSGRYLKIGVSNRVSYREFVSVRGPDVTGYCIDVFMAAVNLLPYAVPFKFFPFGDGRTNPNGSELVRLITTGEYDAAVGDITITTSRTKMVDFTQPYIEPGLVVVAPVKKMNSDAWAFLMPFTPRMWGVTALFFLVVGLVVWFLEHRRNDEFRGTPRKQLTTILWFSFSTWFFSHRETMVSALGRIVLVIWLFVVFIVNASYTASLTSILTVQRLSSPIKGIETLKSSKDPIGYPEGSFVQNYLVEELRINPSRLIPLNSPEAVAKALTAGPKGGGVAAMVDDRAYMEVFLSSRCEFSIVGRDFTKNGWGFAFPKDSPLAVDMSRAILKLSENGDLQRIHDKWLQRRPCSSQGTKTNMDRLSFRSFWGLYLLCGLACVFALFVYLGMILHQFSRHYSEEQHSDRSLQPDRLRTFLSFIDEKEEEVKSRSKRRQLERTSIRTDDSPNYSARGSDYPSSSMSTSNGQVC